VLITAGISDCSPRTEIESERALERNFLYNERLACQTCANENLVIEILNIDNSKK
jgi:ferredoxin